MFHVYVDESYNAAEYWLTGVVVPKDSVAAVSERLTESLNRAKAEHPCLAEIREWHGRDIFRGNGPWREIPPRQRIHFYESALRASVTEPVHFICRGVHRPRLEARYYEPFHPHRVLMPYLLEDVQRGHCRRSPTCTARVMADRHDETAKIIGADLRAATRRGGTAWHRINFGQISETIEWVDSETSPIVQAADLVSYLNLRMRFSDGAPARVVRANQRLWKIVTGSSGSWRLTKGFWKP